MQAVTLQRQSFDDVLAGIVFLGTPHLVTTSAEGWNNLRLLMANKKGVSKQQMDESEIADVISTCRAFEDLGLHRPILSVYERRATKVRDKFYRRRKADTDLVRLSQDYFAKFGFELTSNSLFTSRTCKLNAP